MSERLHKLLAQHGFGSRRELEKWIADGRVLLNDRPAEVGARHEEGDTVVLDGKDISARLRHGAAPAVLLYHKPQDQLLDARHGGDHANLKETVLEQLPSQRGARWLPVNVMNAGDSGLMVFTSDGRLADGLRRQLQHMPAKYVARVLMPDIQRFVELDPQSVQLDEETVVFAQVKAVGGEGSNRWFEVEMKRADRRAAVRALFESHGYKVSRVIQVSLGPLELPRDLPRGRHRVLDSTAMQSLYELAQLPLPESLQQQPRKASRAQAVRSRRASTGKTRKRR